jgi:hypothetical protein
MSNLLAVRSPPARSLYVGHIGQQGDFVCNGNVLSLKKNALRHSLTHNLHTR